jgi:hypothetical protein
MVAYLNMIKFPFIALHVVRVPVLVIYIPVWEGKKVNMAWVLIPVSTLYLHLEPINDWKAVYSSFSMAPRVSQAKTTHVYKTCVDLIVEEATTHYHNYVSPSTQETMHPIEGEVKIIRAYQDDEEIDRQVGDIILDLGCTRNRDTKFHHTIELYWHTKTMVSQAQLPNEKYYMQLCQRLEALEHQNKLLRNGGSFQLTRDGSTLAKPLLPFLNAGAIGGTSKSFAQVFHFYV